VGSDSTFLHSGIKNADTQTDDGGDVSAMRRYDAFGNPLAAWGGWQGPFGYGGPYGYQSDPDHGLMLLGHRYYEADTGRFLTRDPIKDGRNWYGYCGGNSLRYADPDGELPIIVASDGRLVYGYSDHAIDRAISRDGGRGVSPKAILDALKNPIKITPYPNNPTITNYHGRHAMVGVSQEGRITTTIGLSKSGARNPPPYSVNNRLRGLRVGMALFAIVEGASAAAAGMREVMLWHRRTRLQFGPIDGGSDEAADLALGVDPSYNEWDVSRF
jgi:RHS repeat-associated protein